MLPIDETIEILQMRHMQFIEANYHLSHPRLIEERKRLMQEGAIYTKPWVEATPIYVSGQRFSQMGLPPEITNILDIFHRYELGVFDPPYRHQEDGLKEFFIENKDLIVSTGTGSGKTEVFIYSILGEIAREGKRNKTTDKRGFRSIILYPMNALVADQLARLRRIFGSEKGSDELEKLFGRRVQFGMYTSRTPYHGIYDVGKNDRKVKGIIDYFIKLKNDNPQLFDKLKRKGRIPSKDLEGFRNKYKSKILQFRTQPKDSELFTRQEMHSYDGNNPYGGTPDILVTNYSMLEYMLLRPIEQSLFQDTRDWLSEDDENKLIIVVDEAHLYRGSQGAEVALLLRRLLQHLNIKRSRVRFILTSASLGTDETARTDGPKFAADLTGSDIKQFSVILGEKENLENGAPGEKSFAEVLGNIDYNFSYENISKLAQKIKWPKIVKNKDENYVHKYLANQLLENSTFRFLHNSLNEKSEEIDDLSKKIFPNVEINLAKRAVLNLLYLSSNALRPNNQKLFPVRLHAFYKGLPKQYICLNPKCSHKRTMDIDSEFLGRMYKEPKFLCECGSRVFELISHRTCGAAYIKAFRLRNFEDHYPMFLWTEQEEGEHLEEIHILLESPRTDPDPRHKNQLSLFEQTQRRYLDTKTGHLLREIPKDQENRFITVWIPGPNERPNLDNHDAPWTWNRCPACGILERRKPNGRSNIMDLETKGEETFANLIRYLFQLQPENIEALDLPNKGKKVLCFSDGRQKAARLARDLQRTVELDSFREVITRVISELPDDANMKYLFPAILLYTYRTQTAFFDDGDAVIGHYQGSRSDFVSLQKRIPELVSTFRLQREDDLLQNNQIIENLNNSRPAKFKSSLLRLLGDRYYSITSSLVGYLIPTFEVFDSIQNNNKEIEPNLLKEILTEILRKASREMAFDHSIDDSERELSRATTYFPFGRSRTHGECLSTDELIHNDIKERVGELVSDDQWDSLQFSLINSSTSCSLFAWARNQRWAINPEAVKLKIALNEPWYRCQGCKQFSASPLANQCPLCGGQLIVVQQDDPHLTARKSLYRDPCREVIEGVYDPFTIRSEEHSAQLSHRDEADTYSKTELYELLFQDINITDNQNEQPIDVLSCTTTMEVGIDIGSLTGVALRTVPPRSENYQQRAGRAGRRGSALSFIMTFADNSPHESYYFSHPELLVGAPASPLSIYVENIKINERHINACLIQRFFHETGTVQLQRNADVFSSLGLSRDFFVNNGVYSLQEFDRWIKENVLNKNSEIVDDLSWLIPDRLKHSLQTEERDWKINFIQETANIFIQNLQRINNQTIWDSIDEDKTLLSTLLDAALLPTFSFPIDVCNFTVRELDTTQNIVKTRYEMSQELRQALSEYIPERQVVVDKKTFTSKGLYFPFTNDPVNRASVVNWDESDFLNYCSRCETILEEKRQSMEGEICRIQNCGGEINTQRLIRPEGFAPEIIHSRSALNVERRVEARPYATSARFPLPIGQRDEFSHFPVKEINNGSVRTMPNQELLVVNFGLDENGFDICTQCGIIYESGAFVTPHNRPYPRDPRIRTRWPDQCSGSSFNSSLGYYLRTDLTVLRIPIRTPLDLSWERRWFKAALKSLTEALVLGASRELSIDSNELAGGYRHRGPFIDDDPSIIGYIEIFFYDTTPAGAGFSLRVYNNFENVLDSTMALISNCSCSNSCHACLRTYENRVFHDILDRKLAIELLKYVRNGNVPQIDTRQNEILSNQLELTLKLMVPTVEFSKSEEDPFIWIIENNTKKLFLKFRSCLREQSVDPAGDIIEISDYDIYHNLPHRASEIIERIR